MTSRRILVLALVLGGCVDRQVNVGDEMTELPACMVLPAWGHYEDGTSEYIFNEHDLTGTVCMCMSEQELIEQVHEVELNDRGYDECVRMSARYDFAWTDCETFYEEGEWLGNVSAAVDDNAWMNQEELNCGDDDRSGLDCSIAEGNRQSGRWMVMLLACLLVRRRRTVASHTRVDESRPIASTLSRRTPPSSAQPGHQPSMPAQARARRASETSLPVRAPK